MKILVFTTDVIPFPGLATSGTALRTWGLAQGLKCHGHEVILSVPKSALDGMRRTVDIASLDTSLQKQFDDLLSLAFDSRNQADLLASIQPDAVLCGHWPAMSLPLRPSQALVIDLAGPHMLERHYQGSPNQVGATLGKLNAIANADGYIVSGPTQRLYFLSYLLRAQVPNVEQKIVTIPMPLDPKVPERAARTSSDVFPHFVFGGVFLPWQDPSAALHQTASELTRRQRGKLTLIGGSHPNYDIRGGVYERLFSELQKNPRVETKPMLPFQRFVDELMQCDVAVDLMAWNLERELAMTIRSTTYLWAGLPVIYNNYADLGAIIQQYDAGWCIPANSPNALNEVFEEIYSDISIIEKKSLHALQLAREVFSWDRAVLPLLRMLGEQHTESLREIDISFDYPDNANLIIDAERPIEQLFACRIDGLSRVECRFATHGKSFDYPIALSLFEVGTLTGDEPCYLPNQKPKLMSSTLKQPKDIHNNEWVSLELGPIHNSAGKVYSLQMSANAASQSACVSPWAVRGSPFPLLRLMQGEQEVVDAAISLRTTCSKDNGHRIAS